MKIKKIERLFKILNLLGIPAIGVLLVAFYIQQNDIYNVTIESKNSQIELLKAIQNETKYTKEVTIENKNSQIQLLEKLQSDIAVKRLIDAKNVYEEDLKYLMKNIKLMKNKLDSLGVSVNYLKLTSIRTNLDPTPNRNWQTFESYDLNYLGLWGQLNLSNYLYNSQLSELNKILIPLDTVQKKKGVNN